MSDQPQKDVAKSPISERPPRERVFFANAVNWAFTKEQEAVLDFKLVMPEDFRIAKQVAEKDNQEERIQAEVSINLETIPVEVRVYLPFKQFSVMCERMAKVWKTLNESKDPDARTDETQIGESEEG